MTEQTAAAMTMQNAVVVQLADLAAEKWIEEILAAVRRHPVPLVGNDGDVVLSFGEWARMASLSKRTAQEIRARGEGPRCIKLTDKKLGVTLAEHRRWLKSRMESTAA